MKKPNTDPNFPPPSDAPAPAPAGESDDLLAGFEEPGGYQADPHAPPARVEHETFPNAAVIVSQTEPGVAPPPNLLNVSPEERARLEALFKERERARAQQDQVAKLEPGDREADTSPPQRKDPPAVETNPPKKQASMLPMIGVVALALCAVMVIVFVATRRGEGDKKAGEPSATTSSTAVASSPASASPTAPTTVLPTIATTDIEALPTVKPTAHATTTGARPVPSATHTTTATTVAAPTTTAAAPSTGASAPPDIRGSN